MLQWQEITPVLSDIDPCTHTLDPNKVEQMITPRTTGIIAVHLWGHHCDIEALSEIAMRRGLKILFDSAHAFGCSHKGRMIGSFGDAEVFSFHATKFVNSLEGGAVVTDDSELAQKIRLMKNFGFSYYDRTDYFYPGCHRMEPYRSYFPHAGLLLPETERLVNRVLCLPTGTGVDEDQIARICQLFRFAVENGREISHKLGANA